MRISANREEKYPLLGSLLEQIARDIDANPEFRRTLFESCGGRDDDLSHALALNTNPWVTVEPVGGGRSGAYATARQNTIVVAKLNNSVAHVPPRPLNGIPLGSRSRALAAHVEPT